MGGAIPEKVMTLAQNARFFRVAASKVRAMAEARQLPGRKVGSEWRFLRSVLLEWLRGKPDPTQALLEQAGMFKGDESMKQILRDIYKARGRPKDGELAT